MNSSEIRDEYGFPPRIDDFFGEVEPVDPKHEAGWDYRLWVEEWAEAYLGTEAFASLERRFKLVPGVATVAHIDREEFLIRSGLNAKQLRDALWKQFVEAALEGSNRETL